MGGSFYEEIAFHGAYKITRRYVENNNDKTEEKGLWRCTMC